MSLFTSSNKDEQSVLLATIESGAVHATLCLLSPHAKPFIVHSVTKPILFQEHLEFDRFASATLQSLADACQEVIKNGVSHVSSRRVRKGRIDAVYVTYASPWYVSQTQHVDIQKGDTVMVTKDLFAELMETHVTHKSFLTLSDKNDAPKVLTQDVIDIRLNGYSVHDPFGKEARRISFSILMGAISQSFSKYVEDVVGRFFSTESFNHFASPTVFFSGVRDTLATDESFLVLDMSGEITDVSVVRDGILLETVSFPVGVRTSMRSFARRAKVLPNEVLGIMHSLKDTKLDSEKTASYESAATATKADWHSAFSSALIPVLEHAPLPTKALLFGDASEFVRVKDVLVPTALSHPTSGEALDTTLILAEQFLPFCVVREGVRLGHPLVPLSALYVHRLLTMRN